MPHNLELSYKRLHVTHSTGIMSQAPAIKGLIFSPSYIAESIMDEAKNKWELIDHDDHEIVALKIEEGKKEEGVQLFSAKKRRECPQFTLTAHFTLNFS